MAQVTGLQSLVFVVQDGPERGRVYPLTNALFSIGRQATNDIVIKDSRASRLHARIELTPRGLIVIDNSSANGTWVNNVQIGAPQLLRPNDIVQIGGITFLLVENQPSPGPRPEVFQGPPPNFSPPPNNNNFNQQQPLQFQPQPRPTQPPIPPQAPMYGSRPSQPPARPPVNNFNAPPPQNQMRPPLPPVNNFNTPPASPPPIRPPANNVAPPPLQPMPLPPPQIQPPIQNRPQQSPFRLPRPPLLLKSSRSPKLICRLSIALLPPLRSKGRRLAPPFLIICRLRRVCRCGSGILCGSSASRWLLSQAYYYLSGPILA